MGQVVNTQGNKATAVAVADSTPQQYLTFSLGGEMFAVGHPET